MQAEEASEPLSRNLTRLEDDGPLVARTEPHKVP